MFGSVSSIFISGWTLSTTTYLIPPQSYLIARDL